MKVPELIITLIFIILHPAALAQKDSKVIVRIPFRLVNNHIYLKGSINSKPFWFLLDTGSTSILNENTARLLGLNLLSPQKAYGIGDAAADAWFAQNVSIQLQGINHTEKQIGVTSLENVEECIAKITVDPDGKITLRKKPLPAKEYQKIDGVLGGNFFRTFVVEINYKKQFLNLYDPKTYHYSGKGKTIPIEVIYDHIYTTASVTGNDNVSVTGRFMIDCGSMGGLILNPHFTEENKLLPPSGQTTPLAICGIGGYSQARSGYLNMLQIQTVSLKKPRAIFSMASGGVLTHSDFDGNIGNAILRNYKVVFDYSRKQMILE